MRRSAGHADRCVEYFVPRSLSEFNLSGAAGEFTDLGLGERRREGAASGGGGGKSRDKMVTFEDDRGKALPVGDVFM